LGQLHTTFVDLVIPEECAIAFVEPLDLVVEPGCHELMGPGRLDISIVT
jgi:hypothetical protein